jgi:co-chaperonin GroES (HSP10)
LNDGGSGLKRIYEECMADNVKVEFKDLKTGFLVVFYRFEGTTPKTRDKILLLIRQNEGITKEGIILWKGAKQRRSLGNSARQMKEDLFYVVWVNIRQDL